MLIEEELEKGDTLRIGDVRIIISSINGQTVEFSIDAPPHITIRAPASDAPAASDTTQTQ